MLKKILFFFGIAIVHSVNAQYCTNVGPSSTADSNVESVVLIGASGSINYVGCPGVVGLQDLTNLSATLNAGSPYIATIDFGTCGGPYAGAGQAWIDFDQSGTFDPSESIGTWQGTPPAAPQAFNFTAPFSAQNGITRMRVMQYESNSVTLPLDPCASFTWGSVMDFGIVISNGVDCSAYIGDDTSDPIVVTTLPYIDTNDNSFCYGNQNLVYNSPDVYYQLNPTPMMESVSVSLCGSGFDTFLSVVDANGNILAYNDDAPGCGTSSALTFSTDGLGTVYIIVEGWGNSGGEYILEMNANYVGLSESALDKITLFPNPTAGNITINGYSGSLSFVDQSGRVVKNITDYTEKTSISLSELTNGIYFIQFDNLATNEVRKIILGL
jgi:hypothetical protein